MENGGGNSIQGITKFKTKKNTLDSVYKTGSFTNAFRKKRYRKKSDK